MPFSRDRVNASLVNTARMVGRWASGRLGLSPAGALPDVLIIGAQKAGTTSLFEYLAQHPSISVSLTKEVHFFDNAFGRGEAWYRRRFPPRQDSKLVVEASPYYLFHPLAPERAAGMLPSARLIALLREPVARAFSHYQHEVAQGRETLSFDEAVAAEPERLGDSEKHLARGEIARSFEHQNYSYLARGFYAAQIERWLEHFPASQMLVLKAEDLFASPQSAFERVCDFLGLPRFQLRDASPRYQRSYAPLSDATRERLARLYEEPNRRLAELTGISWEEQA
jgi:hypothetical protein